ncbi:hypothetical protein BJX65DRAFT_320991 [Aspergillus insuetus]
MRLPVVTTSLNDPNQKPFPCIFAGCGRQFLRSDTAIRHAKTCAHRNTQTPRRVCIKGKPRSSCGSCAVNRTACDGNRPCRSSFRPRASPALDISSRALSPCSFSSSTSSPLSCSDDLMMATIPFLLHYYSINRSCSNLYLALEMRRPVSDQSPVDSGFYDYNNIRATSPEAVADFSAHGAYILGQMRCTASRLSDAAKAILALEAAAARGIFSGASIDQSTRRFMHSLHRHFPFIHRSTFRVPGASMPLLLAMTLAGCVVTPPPPSDRTSAYTLQLAVGCFDLAEDYIFGLSVFSVDHDCQSQAITPAVIETLMAAVIVVSLQIGRNETESRRRLRQLRLPALVDAARALGLFGDVVHRDHRRDQDDQVFRLATSIYLLDCQLTGCICAAPYIALEELTRGLPCDETSFLKMTMTMMTESPSNLFVSTPTLSEAIGILITDGPQQASVQLQRVSILGLFTVVAGLYSLISCAMRSGKTTQAQSEAKRAMFHRALDMWNIAWKKLLERTDTHELNLVGYMGCAEEIWLLSRVLLRIAPTDLRHAPQAEDRGDGLAEDDEESTLAVPLCAVRRILSRA